jgi:hypothetical protein
MVLTSIFTSASTEQIGLPVLYFEDHGLVTSDKQDITEPVDNIWNRVKLEMGNG